MPPQEVPVPAHSLHYEDRRLADYHYTTAWHSPPRRWILQVGPLQPHSSFMLYLYHRLMHHTTRRTNCPLYETSSYRHRGGKYMPTI